MNEGWGIAGAILTGLFGGGGIVGIFNWRLAKRRGVREDDREDDNAVASQMKIIIDAQFESLVKPLQEEVARLRAEVAEVKTAVEHQRGRYWKVVGYARTLLYWIEKTFPGQSHIVPRAAEDIRSDIEIS